MKPASPAEVAEVRDPAERSRVCELVLRSLPGWFGLEEPVAQYIRAVADLPTFAILDGADPAGFLTLKQHNRSAAEIYVMGVRPELHRRGLGTRLLDHAERFLKRNRVALLHVKTLGPSHPSAGYAATRSFYEARGFLPVEELHELWSPGNPALLMVKPLIGSEPSPEGRLWDILRGALGTRVLAVVAELGVADVLAAGPRPVEDVAREVGADPDTLHRFLRALASDGVFAEEAPGAFRNTDSSELLRGAGWNDFAHLFGGVWYQTVERVDASGEPAFARVFRTDFWSWLAGEPTERAAFDRAMEQGKDRRGERLARLDWRGDEIVVDVGGGNGSLLIDLLGRHPGLRGIVFDLPETVRDEAALGDRIQFVPGSFFERVPAGDVYLLSTILHDWDDERAAAILRTIGATAEPGARLIALDAVIPPGNEPHGNKWLDLLMMVFGGRERDETQWRALLDRAGFEPTRIEDGLIEARCS